MKILCTKNRVFTQDLLNNKKEGEIKEKLKNKEKLTDSEMSRKISLVAVLVLTGSVYLILFGIALVYGISIQAVSFNQMLIPISLAILMLAAGVSLLIKFLND